jgi:hypothetical protein
MKINDQIHDPATLPPKGGPQTPSGGKALLDVVAMKRIIASDWTRILATQSVTIVNLRVKK